jgi:ADP-heptose:LPS heptosyltransferase
LGIWQKDEKYLPFLKMTLEEKQKAQLTPTFIGFHFGASLPLRRLPFSEISLLLSRFQSADLELIVFLSPEEDGVRALLSQLPASLHAKIQFWSGNLREFIMQVSRATHCYFMDSGPAHIAAALGVPTTVFFGPAEAANVRPTGVNVEIISKAFVACRPCDQINCRNPVVQYCMQGLAEQAANNDVRTINESHITITRGKP